MLIVAKRVLGRNFAFATARGKSKKQQTKLEDQYDMEQDVFKAYRKQVEKGSILRQFREEVFRKSELRGDWEVEAVREKKEVQELEKILNVDKESLLSNATQIQAKAIRQRSIFDQNTGRSLLSDYGNYKPYDKVHPVVKDRNLVEGEFLEDTHITQNLYKFIDKLSNDYQEKAQIKQIISTFPADKQGMSLTEYGKILQKQMNDAQREAAKRQEEFKLHDEHKYSIGEQPLNQKTDIDRDWFENNDETYQYTGVQKTVDHQTGDEGLQATLSPKAVDTIYELYLQGWNVRDISKRFGILPARTKFCVWVRAQLYHEVIPKLGVKYYLRGLRFEQKYNQYQTFCDYGLDLDELSNNSILEQIHQWNGQMLDAQRQQDKYQGAMMRLEQENKFNKYEMVQVGTVGKQNGRYKLKEWVIFRGKGSDQYFLKNKLLNPLTRAQKKFNKVYY